MFQIEHMEKIAEEVRAYLKNKPYMLEALERGIVNLSKLSRIISADLKITNFHAIKAALRRYAMDLGSNRSDLEKHALNVLKKSKISVIGGITVLISKKELQVDSIASVKSGGSYLYIISKDSVELSSKVKSNLTVHYSNCSVVIIHSGIDIEKTPGVIAFLSSLLAQWGINVTEFVSFYTDTILVA